MILLSAEKITIWSFGKIFLKADMGHALIAEVEGEAVAGLFIFHFNRVARYMYGMSTDKYRELMPNYLLQWEAIKLSKQLGCESYDMWGGAPDIFDESNSLWGVCIVSKKVSTAQPRDTLALGIILPDPCCTNFTRTFCHVCWTLCAGVANKPRESHSANNF